MRIQLIPQEGGAPIEIAKDLTLIGRKEDCDLRLDHKSVSKLHCVIVKTDGLLLLRDLGSTNGTRVNGQRVRRAALLPNDLLTIAKYKFRVQFGGAAAAADYDKTQNLDPEEVVRLLHQVKPLREDDADDDSDESSPLKPVSLPDVYPDAEPEHRE